jgi:hypothetical protein
MKNKQDKKGTPLGIDGQSINVLEYNATIHANNKAIEKALNIIHDLELSGPESRDMWEDINKIKPEKLQNIIYHIMCHTQNAEAHLHQRIKELEDRMKKMEQTL